MKYRSGKTVVLTGGKFNHIHPGHVRLLKRCRSLGYLIVVLAHDSRNKKPYAVPVRQRKKNLEKLKMADRVVVGSPASFAGVVRRYRPDIIVLGYDQKLPDRETQKTVREMGIRVVRCRRFRNYSTASMQQ